MTLNIASWYGTCGRLTRDSDRSDYSSRWILCEGTVFFFDRLGSDNVDLTWKGAAGSNCAVASGDQSPWMRENYLLSNQIKDFTPAKSDSLWLWGNDQGIETSTIPALCTL
jgi:hypothetical protein